MFRNVHTLSLCRPHISMAVRINSSDGLVLYAAGGSHGGAVMSLSVTDGHLLLLLDGGKRKTSLRSRKKYNDEQWHTVRSHGPPGHVTLQTVETKTDHVTCICPRVTSGVCKARRREDQSHRGRDQLSVQENPRRTPDTSHRTFICRRSPGITDGKNRTRQTERRRVT